MRPSSRIPRSHRSSACASLAAVAAVLLSASPVSAATLYGLVDTGELYASTNNGTTWTIKSTLAVSDAVGLAAGSSTSELYIFSRSGSFYRSSNGGGSWSAVGALTASDVASFTLNYDGAILALTKSGTLYRSDRVRLALYSADGGRVCARLGTRGASRGDVLCASHDRLGEIRLNQVDARPLSASPAPTI